MIFVVPATLRSLPSVPDAPVPYPVSENLLGCNRQKNVSLFADSHFLFLFVFCDPFPVSVPETSPSGSGSKSFVCNALQPMYQFWPIPAFFKRISFRHLPDGERMSRMKKAAVGYAGTGIYQLKLFKTANYHLRVGVFACRGGTAHSKKRPGKAEGYPSSFLGRGKSFSPFI